LNPLLGIVVVLAALGACFGGLLLLQRFADPHPEVLRKLMHVLMGVVVASFPWLFADAWPVLLIAALSLLALITLRTGFPAMRALKGVLHGVERTSWGELLFPVSIAVVFLLAEGDPLLYSVPILILALADAVAALIGVYYGQLQFTTLEGSKSVEGSLAFFIVAFFCVHVALLLFTDVGRAESLLIGLLMGVIVMLFEAVAWRGLDNLFIPVASFALLESYIALDEQALVIRLIVILLLGIALLFFRERSKLDDSALIGAGLVGFVAWAVGGWYYLLVPALVFLITTVLARRAALMQRQQIHTVYALLSISAPGLAWLVLHTSVATPGAFFAYSVAFGAHLAMLGVSRIHQGQSAPPPWCFLPALAQAWIVVVFPFAIQWGVDVRLAWVGVLALLGIGVAMLAFLRLQPELESGPVSPARWARQGLIAAAVSALGWLSLAIEDMAGMSA
jgi:phytol kinase